MSSHKCQIPGPGNTRSQGEVVFTLSLLKKLKSAHQKAKDSGVDVFVFDGKEYVVAFAGYLIEYLGNQFKEV